MLNSISKILFSSLKGNTHLVNVKYIHNGSPLNAWASNIDKERCKHFISYNDKVFPPQSLDEPKRPAYVCNVKTNIKYSYEKMWYIACLVRGMSVDEALKQLQFVPKKGATAAIDTILEAQEMAVKEHNVEFKSNLWVSESFVGKGVVVKGYRRHSKKRMGEVRYGYVHYFVTLEEGKPPENYYPYKQQKSAQDMMAEWLKEMRNRRVVGSL